MQYITLNYSRKLLNYISVIEIQLLDLINNIKMHQLIYF